MISYLDVVKLLQGPPLSCIICSRCCTGLVVLPGGPCHAGLASITTQLTSPNVSDAHLVEQTRPAPHVEHAPMQCNALACSRTGHTMWACATRCQDQGSVELTTAPIWLLNGAGSNLATPPCLSPKLHTCSAAPLCTPQLGSVCPYIGCPAALAFSSHQVPAHSKLGRDCFSTFNGWITCGCRHRDMTDTHALLQSSAQEPLASYGITCKSNMAQPREPASQTVVQSAPYSLSQLSGLFHQLNTCTALTQMHSNNRLTIGHSIQLQLIAGAQTDCPKTTKADRTLCWDVPVRVDMYY